MSTAEWLSVVGAVVVTAFTTGSLVAWFRGQVRQALGAARRAHRRIDDLESQTGKFTTLRERP